MTTTNHNVCKNCILPNDFLGITLNHEGICNFCEDPSHENPNWSKVQISKEKGARSLEDWNAAVADMQAHRGEQEFDCVIGYSGGKDSTALVDTFINEYGLNPLCVTIDTGFMTDIAKSNIAQTLSKMNLEMNSVIIEDAIPVFAKLYKTLFSSHTSNTNALTIDLCTLCTRLIHTVALKEALKHDVKYLIFGFSPDQIRQYFYETSREEIIEDGSVPEMLRPYLSEEELNWYLTDEEKRGNLPRMLYPYHVIPYDEEEIIARIETKGLIERGKGDPVLTNCHVVKAGLMHDLLRYGGLTYALQYAELVRQAPEEEKTDARKKWIRLYSQVGRQILSGTFSAEHIEQFLAHVELSREDLLSKIQKDLEKDPNKQNIKKNLEVLQSRKFK